jgi:hypothetical protein
MRRFLALFILLIAAGCMHVNISRSEKVSGGGPVQNIDLNSFVWGFVPVTIPPEAELCPKSRIETVAIGQNGTDVFLSMITLGIFVPHRAEITCSTALSPAR